jgi:uncharacterized protein involved in exopolysaccharide biosynthesis
MQTRDFVRILLKHRQMIVLLCASAVVNSILITYVVTEKYKASTLVLITPQTEVAVARPTGDKELLNFPVSPVGVSTQTETSTKTYSELIKSRPVVERVVRALGLDKPADTSQASLLTAAYRRLRDGLKAAGTRTVQILKYGRVLEGTAFDKAASEVSERIAVAPTRNSYVFAIDCVWNDPTLAAAVANETARAFVDLLGEMSKGDAQGALQFIERRLHDGEAELGEARLALRKFKEQNHSVAFEEETAQKIRLLAKLEGSFEKTQSELSGLLDQFTDENPKVRNVQAQKNRLAESIAARKSELLKLPAAEAQLATLELNVKTNEQVYKFIARQYEDARIREAKKTSDIRVVAPALVPVRPVRPIKIYYAAVALLMALMVGVAFAFVFELSNPTLCNIDQVQTALGLPVLATVPQIDAFTGS